MFIRLPSALQAKVQTASGKKEVFAIFSENEDIEQTALVMINRFHKASRTLRNSMAFKNREDLLEMHRQDQGFVDEVIRQCRAKNQWRRCPECPSREERPPTD